MIRDNLESPRGARPLRGSLSFERATLSRDGARIRRILAACRTSSGNVGRTRRVLTASGKSSISRTDERRNASFEPRASAAVRSIVLASPGEHRSPELAAHSAANAGVRRACLDLSVRQELIDWPAETDSSGGAYLNTAGRTVIVITVTVYRVDHTQSRGRSRNDAQWSLRIVASKAHDRQHQKKLDEASASTRSASSLISTSKVSSRRSPSCSAICRVNSSSTVSCSS